MTLVVLSVAELVADVVDSSALLLAEDLMTETNVVSEDAVVGT